MGINPGRHLRAEILDFLGDVLVVSVLQIEQLLSRLVHACRRIINLLGQVCNLLAAGNAFLLQLLADVGGNGLDFPLGRLVLLLRPVQLLADLAGYLTGVFMYAAFKFLNAFIDKVDVPADKDFSDSLYLFSGVDGFFWIHGGQGYKGDCWGGRG